MHMECKGGGCTATVQAANSSNTTPQAAVMVIMETTVIIAGGVAAAALRLACCMLPLLCMCVMIAPLSFPGGTQHLARASGVCCMFCWFCLHFKFILYKLRSV
jgi:hypothetical protein